MVIQAVKIGFDGREGSLKRLLITDESSTVRKVLTADWVVVGDYIQISPIQLQNGEDGFAGAKVAAPVVQEVVPQEKAATNDAPASLIAQLFGPIFIGLCSRYPDSSNGVAYSARYIADQALVEATRIAGKIALLEKLQR